MSSVQNVPSQEAKGKAWVDREKERQRGYSRESFTIIYTSNFHTTWPVKMNVLQQSCYLKTLIIIENDFSSLSCLLSDFPVNTYREHKISGSNHAEGLLFSLLLLNIVYKHEVHRAAVAHVVELV